MLLGLCHLLHPFNHVHETAQSGYRTKKQQCVMHFW